MKAAIEPAVYVDPERSQSVFPYWGKETSENGCRRPWFRVSAA